MNTIQAERKGVEEVSLEARLTAAEGLLEEERVLVSELRATMEKQSIMLQRLSMQRRGTLFYHTSDVLYCGCSFVTEETFMRLDFSQHDKTLLEI